MNRTDIIRKLAQRLKPSSMASQLVLCVLAAFPFAGCRAPTRDLSENRPIVEEVSSEPEEPDRPRPVLPDVAFFLGNYANLELSITATRDGTIHSVAISKPSLAKLYDEYTRKWVETHWRMAAAKPDEPELRTFIAPIVYPHKWPSGAKLPLPDYPFFFQHDHIQGLVLLELEVEPSGKIGAVRVARSSGHKQLDSYAANWVKTRWSFPAGVSRAYQIPIAFVLKGP